MVDMFLALDYEVAVVLGVVAAMAANQLVMRVAGLKARRGVFWALQGMNLLVGSVVVIYGLPGLPRVVAWFVALLFFFRTVVNNNNRLAWLEEQQREAHDADGAKREALRAALARGEAE